jgi:hypothetical protein
MSKLNEQYPVLELSDDTLISGETLGHNRSYNLENIGSSTSNEFPVLFSPVQDYSYALMIISQNLANRTDSMSEYSDRLYELINVIFQTKLTKLV